MSTTVEIILYYLTYVIKFDYISSTTVEIILYYLTNKSKRGGRHIYNSRNYSILLNNLSLPLDAFYLQQ